MLKILIFVVILAMPILCGIIEEGKKKLAFDIIIENEWKEKCKNVSGIEINIEQNDRLYQEYENCKKGAIDNIQVREDIVKIFPNLTLDHLDSISIFPLSDVQKTDLLVVTKKYCPKIDSSLRCRDKLSPIYDECYTTEEKNGVRLQDNINLSINNYFCKNGSESVTNFLDGKVIECGMDKKNELMECLENYILASLKVDKESPVFGLIPKVDNLCSSIQTFRLCVVPIFEQCELS